MSDPTNPLGEVEAVDAIANLLEGPDDREPEIEEEEAADLASASAFFDLGIVKPRGMLFFRQ
jgi:hypothetical protein